MNAFEEIAARHFEAQGYWTRIGVKVEFTKEDKRVLDNPTMPRPEVDIVAYKPAANSLILVECKSYLDSTGVSMDNFVGENQVLRNRFKLLNREELRNLVTRRLIEQFREQGLFHDDTPQVSYALVVGKFKQGDETAVIQLFQHRNWTLITPTELVASLRAFSERGYEDDLLTVTVKLLERNREA